MVFFFLISFSIELFSRSMFIVILEDQEWDLTVRLYVLMLRYEFNMHSRIYLKLHSLICCIYATFIGRFLEKGGLKVLCAWLINAAAGEQTSVLRQLLNVLVKTYGSILMWSVGYIFLCSVTEVCLKG